MEQPTILLDGKKKDHLNALLRDVFTLEQFDRMLYKYLTVKREDIILEHHIGREELFEKVIEEVDRLGNIPKLLDAALEECPKNIRIFSFAQQFGLPITLPPPPEMERIIDEKNVYIDPELLVDGLLPLLHQVCSIEERGKHVGTGFLIGPCLIMTNYHVVQGLLNGMLLPTEITCRFDSRVMKDGTTVREGVEYRLNEKAWRIDESPYHPLEFTTYDVEPSTDQLDYALLKLEDAPVNAHSHPPPPRLLERGWIKPYAKRYEFQRDTSLYILHYPKLAPDESSASKVSLKFSMDTRTILGENSNKTRVQYRTNTEVGSSGGPCFTKNFELVALHHAGDPSQKPQYNQGIPFVAILQKLIQGNKLHFLALETSDISALFSSPSPSHCTHQQSAEIIVPSVFPQSTTVVIVPTSLTETIKLALDAFSLSIQTARTPFMSEGSIRRNQYKNAYKILQEDEKHIQHVKSLLSSSTHFPSYFPDRETLDTDISIVNAHLTALLQLLKDPKPRLEIQASFLELEKAFNRLSKALLEPTSYERQKRLR